ncbi:hypothetical protein NUU61_005335 [Penicillium alfredii]|uniref:Clr5 domain-containing protein n=1 Tax=Penicillium alfredii TaxID=1506179 RepID=A0A9W9F9D4_9EURO|nr:uncharacterized protein NUU61_005335 [Penicillium alfredii]KAJ5095979.1 hypothetical protein NUU61_005335 [Penicillium alfredii]
MPAKAHQIRDDIWNQHKEETIDFYLVPNSLDRTMEYMAEKYGFRASENQYTRKLESWGIRKYVPGSSWVSVASVKRKRTQEGKDSDFAFYGRKYTRQKVDKEIARHVSSRTELTSSGNAVLPDYITISTPQTESTGISREFLFVTFLCTDTHRIYKPLFRVDSPQKRFLLNPTAICPNCVFNTDYDWIMDKWGADILVFLCRLESPSMKIFARKVLLSAVESENLHLASELTRHGAQSQGHIEVAERLIESGADVNVPTVHLIQHYRWPNSRTLGAKVDAPATEMGTTALLAATKYKSLPLFKILVQNGANVNPTGDCELNSPLREAAMQNWFKGVKFLLVHGAEVNDTPFEKAASDEYTDTVNKLQSPLGWAIWNDAEEMVNSLLRHGADVLATAPFDRIDSGGALIYALRQDLSLSLIDRLFEEVQELEKHTGWENALETVLEDFIGWNFDLFELMLRRNKLNATASSSQGNPKGMGRITSI